MFTCGTFTRFARIWFDRNGEISTPVEAWKLKYGQLTRALFKDCPGNYNHCTLHCFPPILWFVNFRKVEKARCSNCEEKGGKEISSSSSCHRLCYLKRSPWLETSGSSLDCTRGNGPRQVSRSRRHGRLRQEVHFQFGGCFEQFQR